MLLNNQKKKAVLMVASKIKLPGEASAEPKKGMESESMHKYAMLSAMSEFVKCVAASDSKGALMYLQDLMDMHEAKEEESETEDNSSSMT